MGIAWNNTSTSSVSIGRVGWRVVSVMLSIIIAFELCVLLSDVCSYASEFRIPTDRKALFLPTLHFVSGIESFLFLFCIYQLKGSLVFTFPVRDEKVYSNSNESIYNNWQPGRFSMVAIRCNNYMAKRDTVGSRESRITGGFLTLSTIFKDLYLVGP